MYNLVRYDHPILKKECMDYPFDEAERYIQTNTEFGDGFDGLISPYKLAQTLVDIMVQKKGYGLSANQIGLPYKVFAMEGFPERYVIFNPVLVHVSDTEVEIEEGCLSCPGVQLNIKRPESIRLRFKGPNGETFTKPFEGLSARAVLHEMDHGMGIPFLKKVSKLKGDMAIKKANKKYNVDYVYHRMVK